MARRRAMSRRKKTALYLVGGGIAVGLAAVFLLPLMRRRVQDPLITIPSGEILVGGQHLPAQDAPDYNPQEPINEGALTWLTPEQRAALEWS